MARNEPLRNSAIAAALEQGLARRNYGDIEALLVRSGGLPGPRPNWGLAWAFAGAVAAAGNRADGLVAELLAIDASRAPARSAVEFLPAVGAFCVASRALAAPALDPELDGLMALAEDTRHLVREAVVLALVQIGVERSDDLLASLEPWIQQYLPAATALTAIATR
ncbi:MAG TPA: hypothetical protein VGL13_18155, partial [Polyangiaceae bacterium]